MKKCILLLMATLGAAVSVLNARADVYVDATNDLFTTAPQLDISSVVVTNDTSHLIFTINMVGNPDNPNWGHYDIALATGPAGDTIDNGTGAYISWTPGMNYWVDSQGWGGATLYQFDTTSLTWTNIAGATFSAGTDGHSMTLSIPLLGLTTGQSFQFDVFTGGGASQGAMDDLANTNMASSWWNVPYIGSYYETYTLQSVASPITNQVSFVVNMEVPIWEHDNGLGGFNTNSDSLYVLGNFNAYTASAACQLFQVGSTLFSNTVQVVQETGQNTDYYFYGSNPGAESPVLHTNGYRQIVLSSPDQSIAAPMAYWSDRHLSDPTNYVTLQVNMALQSRYGYFDPATNQVTMVGNFNAWNTTNTVLTAGTGANSNLYSLTLVYPHYPTNSYGLTGYKFFITNLPIPTRDNGWEDPISTSGGNRTLSLSSSSQTNTFYYNDETPFFNITSLQWTNSDSATVNWNSYPTHGRVNYGGIYEIDSSADLTSGIWTSNGIVSSTTSSSTFTVTNLTGSSQQYFRINLIGL